ncbi:unnamed protein product [Peronospora belbahrii]|uniref:Uncharacterized protein n=2 Tax=Peronospora belbahrii TaxID=622444 RepID=A0AAU9KSA1_9STRA|nr:unnamed protein product [Peronospora belbahrii]CAH0474496.1 unnamed protein product [Peronospora belbahrii]CAH0474498.1 unnamed protein product [Peronospora belbahrii]
MKITSTVTAIAIVYMMSFVTANHLNVSDVMMTSDNAMMSNKAMMTDIAMTSDNALTSDTNSSQAMVSADQTISTMPTMRGKSTALPVTVGVVSNKVDANGNNILITKSNILISKSDRVKLAHTIKEMLSSSPEASTASSMSIDDLFVLLTNIATNSAMLSHAAGVISAARSGDTGALSGHIVGLLGAAVPAAIMSPSTFGTPAPAVAPVATSGTADVAVPAAAPISPMTPHEAPAMSA